MASQFVVTANQEENETMFGNADGLKRVLKLADKQDYVLKDFDKEKTDLQNRAEQWKDTKSTQEDRDRILNALAIMN